MSISLDPATRAINIFVWWSKIQVINVTIFLDEGDINGSAFKLKRNCVCVCVYTDYIHDSFLSIINQNNTIIESDSSFTNWFVLFRIKWIQDKRSPISILKKYCFRRLKKKNSKKKNSCQVWSQETACHSENKKGHVLMTSCPCAITSLFSSLD